MSLRHGAALSNNCRKTTAMLETTVVGCVRFRVEVADNATTTACGVRRRTRMLGPEGVDDTTRLDESVWHMQRSGESAFSGTSEETATRLPAVAPHSPDANSEGPLPGTPR